MNSPKYQQCNRKQKPWKHDLKQPKAWNNLTAPQSNFNSSVPMININEKFGDQKSTGALWNKGKNTTLLLPINPHQRVHCKNRQQPLMTGHIFAVMYCCFANLFFLRSSICLSGSFSKIIKARLPSLPSVKRGKEFVTPSTIFHTFLQ